MTVSCMVFVDLVQALQIYQQLHAFVQGNDCWGQLREVVIFLVNRKESHKIPEE